jgi:Short C-terminal domain
VTEHRELAGGNALAAAYPGCSTARLYAGAVRAVSELGFDLIGRDDAATTLTFRTPGPTPAWPGIEMTAAISQVGDAARLVIGGNRFSGYQRQAVAYQGAKDIAIIFLDRLNVVLPTVAEPATDVPAPASRFDQLRSLAELRDRGLLTEGEFEAEKTRLLADTGGPVA